MLIAPPSKYLQSANPIKQLPGGLIGWALVKKGAFTAADGTAITVFDKAFWDALIAQNTATELHMMARIDCTYMKGSVSEPNFNENTIGNCQTPVIKNGTLDFTTTDFAEDAAFSNFDPYEYMRWNWDVISKGYVFVFFNKQGDMFAGRDHSDMSVNPLPVVGYSVQTLRAIDVLGEVDTDDVSHNLTVTHRFTGTYYSVKPVPTGILEVVSDDLHAQVS